MLARREKRGRKEEEKGRKEGEKRSEGERREGKERGVPGQKWAAQKKLTAIGSREIAARLRWRSMRLAAMKREMGERRKKERGEREERKNSESERTRDRRDSTNLISPSPLSLSHTGEESK